VVRRQARARAPKSNHVSKKTAKIKKEQEEIRLTYLELDRQHKQVLHRIKLSYARVLCTMTGKSFHEMYFFEGWRHKFG